MFTENGVLIDFEELRKVIDKCDVFTVGFRLFSERMIVDTRTTGEEGPMLEIVASGMRFAGRRSLRRSPNATGPPA